MNVLTDQELETPKLKQYLSLQPINTSYGMPQQVSPWKQVEYTECSDTVMHKYIIFLTTGLCYHALTQSPVSP